MKVAQNVYRLINFLSAFSLSDRVDDVSTRAWPRSCFNTREEQCDLCSKIDGAIGSDHAICRRRGARDSCSFAGHVYERYTALARPVYDRSHVRRRATRKLLIYHKIKRVGSGSQRARYRATQ